MSIVVLLNGSTKKSSLILTIILDSRYAQSRNRTSDTRIFSPLLYRLSYLGKYNMYIHTKARDGTRTRDPLLGKEMLYQLSHSRINHLLSILHLLSNVNLFNFRTEPPGNRTRDNLIKSQVLYRLS